MFGGSRPFHVVLLKMVFSLERRHHVGLKVCHGENRLNLGAQKVLHRPRILLLRIAGSSLGLCQPGIFRLFGEEDAGDFPEAMDESRSRMLLQEHELATMDESRSRTGTRRYYVGSDEGLSIADASRNPTFLSWKP